MTESRKLFFWRVGLAILLSVICITIGFALGRVTGIAYTKADAVKQGHARFVVMDEFGHTAFEWLGKGDAPTSK